MLRSVYGIAEHISMCQWRPLGCSFGKKKRKFIPSNVATETWPKAWFMQTSGFVTQHCVNCTQQSLQSQLYRVTVQSIKHMFLNFMFIFHSNHSSQHGKFLLCLMTFKESCNTKDFEKDLCLILFRKLCNVFFPQHLLCVPRFVVKLPVMHVTGSWRCYNAWVRRPINTVWAQTLTAPQRQHSI